MLREVHGWAEFPGCVGPLAATPGYDTAIGDFCELQYNYLTHAPPKDIFNPYARLIHETLNGYISILLTSIIVLAVILGAVHISTAVVKEFVDLQLK